MMKHNLHSKDSSPKIPLFHFFIRGYGVGLCRKPNAVKVQAPVSGILAACPPLV